MSRFKSEVAHQENMARNGSASHLWQAEDVLALRERLGVDRPVLARIVGVDTRTIFRWEAGDVHPSGPAEGVLTGLREALRASPDTADEVVHFVVGAASIGGLAYLMLKLLESVPRTGSINRR